MLKNLVLVSGLDQYSRRPERYALSTGKLTDISKERFAFFISLIRLLDQ
jgi:hypothetical protein